MKQLQQALFEALGQYAGLSALVGARIYPDAAPQSTTKPYVVWQEISERPMADMSGTLDGTGGLHNYRVQINSWALNQTQAREVDKQVRRAMQAASGFKSLLADARAMDYEPDPKVYGYSSDFSVWLKLTA